MDKVVKVFLSSPSIGLDGYRDAAFNALEGVSYHCVRMESFPSSVTKIRAQCTKKIEDCDVFILLLGPVYGSLVPRKKISYTEFEYQVALDLEKPILVFQGTMPIPYRLSQHIRKTGQQQEDFQKRVASKETNIPEFSNPDELKYLLLQALKELENTGKKSPRRKTLSVPVIILCGGRAQRLSPLTRDTCKELLPIAGVPVLKRLMDHLEASKVATAVNVVVGHDHYKQVKEFLSDSQWKFKVILIKEPPPPKNEDRLGALGALKHALKKLPNEPILLLAGDNVFEEDLNRFVDMAQRFNTSANLLYKLNTGMEARSYGVATLDGDEVFMTSFKEKQRIPASILVSTACYYLVPEDAHRVSTFLEKRGYSETLGSFLKWLQEEGTKVAGCITDQPWFDIGTRIKYLEASRHYLRDIHAKSSIGTHAIIKGPVMIEKGVRIDDGATVGPNTYLGHGVVVEGNSEVRNSIIMEGARIVSATVYDSIIGQNAAIRGHFVGFLVCQGAHVVREPHTMPVLSK